MVDLRGTRALEQIQANLSYKVLFNLLTVNESGIMYERFKRERVLYNDRTEMVPNGKL